MARKKYYALYTEKDKFQDTANKEFVKKLFNTYLEINVSGAKEIKGLIVSRGRDRVVDGYVKIVKNPFKDGKKMKEGNILVAGMTSPEFIVVMRKAKAIITDQGGMTSHAAIVSRELKIPCIVGTKVATKALKDGDLVEVDSGRGMVKIVKKAS